MTNLSIMSDNYLKALRREVKIDGGILCHDQVDISRLDGSLISLKYIDEFLDLIHEADVVSVNMLSEQSLQNLIYALGFYVGHVIGRENGEEVTWLTNEDFKRINPSAQQATGDGFEVSIVFQTSETIVFPLPSIMCRLFEGKDEKSVWYSAQIGLRKAKVPKVKTGIRPRKVEGKKPWWKIW